MSEGFYFVPFNGVLSPLIFVSWRSALFCRETEGERICGEGRWRELVEVQQEETVVWVYCVREEKTFNNKSVF